MGIPLFFFFFSFSAGNLETDLVPPCGRGEIAQRGRQSFGAFRMATNAIPALQSFLPRNPCRRFPLRSSSESPRTHQIHGVDGSRMPAHVYSALPARNDRYARPRSHSTGKDCTSLLVMQRPGQFAAPPGNIPVGVLSNPDNRSSTGLVKRLGKRPILFQC